ncbi:four helix bundle protein [Maribacter sp. 2308TA10-17]|uniref:four helix bundle protein n=1 Tax=Maribacter sp. 2308TA10-17 TaxID=3386276 RepID=UPI0039BCF0F7
MEKQKVYNLEERTYLFAKECRLLVRSIPKTLSNIEDGKQLIRASGSVGANYIEANEKLGDKDFLMRLKISRKEAKEAQYWLRLLGDLNGASKAEIDELTQEALELRNILSSILKKQNSSKTKQ